MLTAELPTTGSVPLEAILCTQELARRPPRQPDHATENATLMRLVQALADSPGSILQILADTLLQNFKAESAGVSLLARDGKTFFWPAVAGAWQQLIGSGTPRGFGPCGDVLDGDAPLLFTHPERRYTYLEAISPAIEEALLAPFYVQGRAVGTLWLVAHGKTRRFDAEDLRQLQSIGRFAAAAFQAAETLETAKRSGLALKLLNADLKESGERYRTLFDSIDDGFCIIEKTATGPGEASDFRYIEANPAFTRHTGLADLRGKTLRQVVEVAGADEWAATYDEVLRTGTPHLFERELAGTGRLLELHAFRIEDAALRRVGVVFRDITERRRRDELLRLNQETFSSLIQAAPFGMYVVDAQFRLHQLSAAAQKVFSHIQPLLGRDFAEILRIIWPEPFASEAIGRFRHTMETGESYAAPVVANQRGNVPDIEAYDWRIARISLPDGQFGVVCYFYDVSERELAAEALRTSMEFNRSIIDSSPDWIEVLDLQGNTLSIQSGQQLLGIDDMRPFIDTPWVELWMGEDRTAARAAVARVANGGGTGSFVGSFYTVQGEPRCWDVSVSPIFDAGGVLPVRLLAVARDMTERMLAGEKLRESQRFLRSSLDALSGHVAVLGESGIILEVNETWRRFADANQFVGSNYGVGSNYLPGLDQTRPHSGGAASYAEGIQDVIAGRRQRYELEYSCHSPTRRRWFTMQVTRFQSPGPVRVVIVHDDCTERKLAEIALQEQSLALAELHDRKDEFLAMLSHELRNPLAALSSAAQIMALDKNPDPMQGQARAITVRQIRQLTHLVDDLMEVSRITTGKLQLRLEPVALGVPVARAVETTRSMLQQRGHRLTVSLPAQPLWLQADAARLEQVLVNLLTNAAKYTESGGRIDLVAREEDGFAVLRLRDTGIGIAPELLPRIFDMFTQAERSLDRSQGGLGIGLCLVKRLVQLHGGEVEAHSVLGSGSEFTVRLPLAAAPALPVSGPAPDAAAPAGGRRVLVVDDNLDAALSLAMLLQATGHEVRTAPDGPTALEAALQFQPEIVLLDIGLPGLDGYQVARRLRLLAGLENVVLAAMTGYGMESDRQRALDAGFDHHMVKPIDFARVQDILVRAAPPAPRHSPPAPRHSQPAP